MNKIIVCMVSFFTTWLILHSFSFTAIGAPAAGLLMYPLYLFSFIVIYAFVHAVIWYFGRYFLGEQDEDEAENRYFLGKSEKTTQSTNAFVKTASKSFTLAGKIITGALGTLFVVIVLFVLLLKYNGSQRVEESFHKSYPVRNYHDSNITFYEKNLDKYSQKFVEGQDKKEVFEAYIKKSIALKCINHILKNHLDSKKVYKMQGNFDRFYRNKYAVNQELIDNAIENMDFIDDANDIAYIDSAVAYSIYHDSTNACQNLTDVEVLYPSFKEQYLYMVQAKIKSTKEGKNYKFNYLLKSKADDYKELLEVIGG